MHSLLGHHFSTWQFLLAINVLLLVLGCFLEVTATLLLVLPILAPALMPLGVDPVHFSIIFTHNMEIGLVHPPVGLNLFVLSTISAAPIGEVIRGILPFLILLLIVLDHHLRARPDAVAARSAAGQMTAFLGQNSYSVFERSGYRFVSRKRVKTKD